MTAPDHMPEMFENRLHEPGHPHRSLRHGVEPGSATNEVTALTLSYGGIDLTSTTLVDSGKAGLR